MQLPVQSLLNLRWKLRTIYLMCLRVTYICKCLIRILDYWRCLIRSHRFNPLHHVSYHVCVGYDYFPCLITSKILEFRQHFLRCPEVERWLHVRIVKSLALHDYRSVYIVLRIQEMDITCSDNRLVEHLAKLHYPLVVLYQIVHGLWISSIPCHELIVANGLYLQVVKPVYQSHYLFIGSIVNDGSEQFSRLAGRSQYQSLPVFVDETHRHTRSSRKVRKMRLRDEPVQIDPADLILCQDDPMVCLVLFYGVR